MLIDREGNTIVITVEYYWDWQDLFGNGKENEITFELNAEVLDAFFPDWDTYIDEQNPFESLKMEDIKRIDTVHFQIAEDIPGLEDIAREGMYDIVGGDCHLFAQDPETGEDRNFREFLDFTGTATFKIRKPTIPTTIKLSTEVTDEDIANGVKDEFGVVYSMDGKRLLFVQNQDIASYVIKPGTQVICDEAFYWCEKLTNITLPDSVTHIGKDVFAECAELSEVIISNSVLYIGDGAFSNCEKLSEFNIPDSVTHIGDNAFFGCSGLSYIYIPNSVTHIGDGAFLGCSEMSSIKLPDSITFISHNAFYDCCSLTSVIIPKSVTYIGQSAFSGCEHLTCITIPNLVTHIGDCAFSGCRNLASITIPDSVTHIGKNAFRWIGSRGEIHIPTGTYDKFKELLPGLEDIFVED